MAKFILKDRLKDSGFPVHDRNYERAHQRADRLEKQKFPKGYEKLKRIDARLDKHELAGKNTKTGKIYVSERIPKGLRNEVSFHEKTENKYLRKIDRKK